MISPREEGQILALSAAFCWAISSISFSKAGRKVGSLPVNILRLAMAIAFLTLFSAVIRHRWLPTDASLHNWVWLSLSGLVGFFLGDLFLFRAFVIIGPRLSTLLMTLAAPIAAITGWLWIDETISFWSLIGMAITIAGVWWVVMERPLDKAGQPVHVSIRGVFYGILGAAGQGVGLVLGKIGMRPPDSEMGGTDPLALTNYHQVPATQIRALAGFVGFLVLFAVLKRFGRLAGALKEPRAVGYIALGALVGPAIGVALLLRSTQLIPSGISQTLVATVPVIILPFVILFDNERVSWRAAVGAAVSIAGVALLFTSESVAEWIAELVGRS